MQSEYKLSVTLNLKVNCKNATNIYYEILVIEIAGIVRNDTKIIIFMNIIPEIW